MNEVTNYQKPSTRAHEGTGLALHTNRLVSAQIIESACVRRQKRQRDLSACTLRNSRRRISGTERSFKTSRFKTPASRRSRSARAS